MSKKTTYLFGYPDISLKLGLFLLCALTSFSQELSKEYIRLGGRLVAIEGGFGVTISRDVDTIGPGQFGFFTALPSEAGIVVTCAPSCVLDSAEDFRWRFTAPSTGGGSASATVTATLNGRTKNTLVTFTIATAPIDTVQVFASSAGANPGELRKVTAVAQAASGLAPAIVLTAEKLLGLGASVANLQSVPGQPAGVAKTTMDYVAPKALIQANTETFKAVAVTSSNSTVTASRNLNVAALVINAPANICAAGSISATVSTNLAGATYTWQLSGDANPSAGPSYLRTPAAAGNLILRVFSNGLQVASRTIIVTTAGCTLQVAPAYTSLLPGQTQQFSTTPPAANLNWQASHGTITPAGLYTAPPAASTAVLASIFAINAANGQVIGTGFVQLSSNATITLTPTAVTLGPGQQQVFTYALTPAGSGIGTFESPPLAVAPITSGTNQFTMNVSPSLDEVINTYLRVTSGADSTKTAEASIQLRPNVGISVNAPNGATALRPDRQTQVNAVLTGVRDTSVTWELTPNLGSITAGGWYTAPAAITATQVVSVRARSVVDPTKSAATNLTLKPPVAVSVSPTSTVPLFANATQQFTASVTGLGSPNTAVTWSVIPNGVGTVSAGGLYTAPPDNFSAATIKVRATSVEDPQTWAEANVSLGSVNIVVSPSTVSVRPNESVQFSASLPSGGAVPPLTWWAQPGTGAVITQTGLYTAPSAISEVFNTYAGAQVTANPANGASAWVILTPPPPLWVGAVDPMNSFGPTQSFNFRATDSNGAANIDTMTATFQTPGAAFPECQIVFTPATGNLQLFYRYYDSYWGQWFVAAYNGQVGGPISTMNNGQCAVNSAYATQDGNLRTLTLGMSFTPGPVYQVSRAATNLQGNITGNVLAGTWRTMPNVNISLLPIATTLGAGGQQQFGVTISGTTNTAVTWAVISGPGTVSATGRYTAPASLSPTSATVRVTSNADPSKSATSTITLQAPSSISVSMLTPTGTVNAGQTYQLGASVSGTPNSELAWTVVTGGGAVNASTGLYTAPSVVASAFTATLRATSVADPARFATATLTVNPSPVTVSVSPASVTVTGGSSAQFTATVGGTANPAVNWTVSPSGFGNVSTTGLFTAGNPSALTNVTLTATSVADPAKFATAAIAIQPQSPVTLVSFTPTNVNDQSSNLTLTGRTAQGPINLWFSVGEPDYDPYNYTIPCAFYFSGSTGGLAWAGTDPGSASWLSNGSCGVGLNSVTYDPGTGNWTASVNVYRYGYGYRPLKARITSPVGDTGWTNVGYWNY